MKTSAIKIHGLSSQRWVVLVMLVAVGVTACGGESAPAATAGDVDALIADLNLAEGALPLDAVLGFSNENETDPLVAAEQRFLESTQACMRRLGFSYQLPASFAVVALPSNQSGLDPVEYAAEYGFGQSTLLVDRLEQIVGSATGNLQIDPNAEALAQMSDQEALAWSEALYGPTVELDFESGKFVDPETGELVEESPFAGQGCEALAQEEAFGAKAALREELSDEIEELESRIRSSPEVALLNNEWTICIKENGFSFASPVEMRADLDERVDAIVGDIIGIDATVHPSLWGPVTATLDDLSFEAEAELAELQEYERNLAQAALACSGSYDDELRAIRADFERDFVGANAKVIRDSLSE